MVSHRLGETTERFIAGYGRTGIRQIKSDATARGERSTKIGRFVEIETTDELPRGREK
jgi:enolase